MDYFIAQNLDIWGWNIKMKDCRLKFQIHLNTKSTEKVLKCMDKREQVVHKIRNVHLVLLIFRWLLALYIVTPVIISIT